jgi:hypothetical protein
MAPAKSLQNTCRKIRRSIVYHSRHFNVDRRMVNYHIRHWLDSDICRLDICDNRVLQHEVSAIPTIRTTVQWVHIAANTAKPNPNKRGQTNKPKQPLNSNGEELDERAN